MMKYFICGFFIFLSLSSFSQLSKKIGGKTKLITFQYSRLAVAADFNYGYASLAPKPTDFVFGTRLNIGLLVHAYSPLSTIGFVTGIGYSAQEHKIGERNENILTGDSISITSLEIPFYVKFRIGKVSSKYKMIVMPGLAYSFVQAAKIESDFYATINDKKLAENDLSYRLHLGCEIALGRQSRKEFSGEYVSYARTRLIPYLGINYSRSSIYNQDFEGVPETALSQFSELGVSNGWSVYGGVSAYFTWSEWKELIKEFLN